MADEPGFNIGPDFYSFPTAFRLGDPVLVAEVTGMDWNDFAQLLDDGDPRTLAGLVAVAIWQKHPGWKRDKVLRMVEALPLDALEFTGADDDAVPPPVAGSSDTTDGLPAASTATSETAAASASGPLVSSDVSLEPTGLQPSEIYAA